MPAPLSTAAAKLPAPPAPGIGRDSRRTTRDTTENDNIRNLYNSFLALFADDFALQGRRISRKGPNWRRAGPSRALSNVYGNAFVYA
jgi:hypothetical protein